MCQPAIPDELLLLLLKNGGQREAVDMYQEEMGVSAAEARRQVKKLARQNSGRWSADSYADVILLLLVAVSLILGVLLA